MITRYCETCGKAIKRRVVCSYAEYSRRRWCDMDCRRAAPKRERRRCSAPRRNNTSTPSTIGRDEDVEFLLGVGEAPAQIAKRLGLQSNSLGRWLERHDRPDLARPFYRADWRERQAA